MVFRVLGSILRRKNEKKSKFCHKTTKIYTSSVEFYSVSGCVYVYFVGDVVVSLFVCLFLLFVCLFLLVS